MQTELAASETKPNKMIEQIEIVTATSTIVTTINWAKWETPEMAVTALAKQIGIEILHWYFA